MKKLIPYTIYHIPYTIYHTLFRAGFIVPLFFFYISSPASAQDIDIVSYLKQIESGNKEEAAASLPELKKEYPNSPSIMFLEGVLTENGQDAVAIYSNVVNTYPLSKYADAALYRIYSYYFALGLYETAKGHLDKLKKNYPESPYIKIADRNIPSEDEFSDIPVTNDKTTVTEKKDIKYKYTIQAGAFSKLSNAQSLRDDFKDSGFFTEIKEKIVGGTAFHVVYVGQFNAEDEAKNFLQVINKEYKLEGRVVRIE